ncbi:MAG: hypothetical protein HY349_07065 [Nitrospirae bacterium]|nr:hypothetical protein [Nitrospirota bacterium]
MNKIRHQQGSVALFVTLGILSLIGFAALAVDVGYIYAYHWKLQHSADAAALAAARYITDMAEDPAAVALRLAGDNGIGTEPSTAISVSTGCWNGSAFSTPCALPNAAAVTITDTQNSLLANALNIQNFSFSNTSVALMELNPPQILSGRDVRFNGGLQVQVSGDDLRIHANANLTVNGRLSVTNDPDNPGNVTLSATGVMSPSSQGESGATPYSIPTVNMAALEAKARASGIYYDEGLTLNMEDLSGRSGVVYVNGDVTIESSRCGGGSLSNITVVSSGTMTFRASEVSGQTDPSSGGVTVYFVSGGDMKFLGSVDQIEGGVFRSAGEIAVNGGGGSDVVLQTTFFIADGDVRFNGGLRDVEYQETIDVVAPLFQLPGMTSRLVL